MQGTRKQAGGSVQLMQVRAFEFFDGRRLYVDGAVVLPHLDDISVAIVPDRREIGR